MLYQEGENSSSTPTGIDHLEYRRYGTLTGGNSSVPCRVAGQVNIAGSSNESRSPQV